VDKLLPKTKRLCYKNFLVLDKDSFIKWREAANTHSEDHLMSALASIPESIASGDTSILLNTSPSSTSGIPDYLERTYHWAYLSRRGRALLDRSFIVSAILWGNARRLMKAAAAEFTPGQKILQSACVYGNFSQLLAQRVGTKGKLTVIDVAPIQIEYCQRKLLPYPQANARVADATVPFPEDVDGICCFFLLHEVPEDYKTRIVDNLLGSVKPGGKVVFVDYHRPHSFHPLKGIMALVFRWLEPYAIIMWKREIQSYSKQAEKFNWEKCTYFGGLYQKVIAVRRSN
jgi:SAM-dependent methyltransferase